MTLLSFEFLGFLLIVLLAYHALPVGIRWTVPAAASAVFLYFAGWESLVYVTAVAALTWIGGRLLTRLREGDGASPRRKVLLGVLLALEMGAMMTIKYQPAAAAWLNGLISGEGSGPLSVWDLAVPLGLSYYTFQSAGFLIDIYRGKASVPKNPVKTWLFIGWFPQLTQGPISSWREVGGALSQGHRFDPDRFVSGFLLMLWGYFKKLVIADRLAKTTQAVLAEDAALPGWLILGCVILYAVRLYAGFSGGIDLVRGVSRMFGIELPENFRRPFFAVSVAEYWRRWHITLGVWFRTYVLYPFTVSGPGLSLGKKAGRVFGEKTGRLVPTALGVFLVFLLIGIWHGASWNAVIYGAYFGAVMAFSTLMGPVWKRMNKRSKALKTKGFDTLRLVRTWAIVLLIQYFAFTDTPGQALGLLRDTFGNWSFAAFAQQVGAVMPALEWLIAGIGLAVLLTVDIICEKKGDLCGKIARGPVALRWPVMLALIAAILVFGCYGEGFDKTAFIYNRF